MHVCMCACASAIIILYYYYREARILLFPFCSQPEWFHSLPPRGCLDSALHSDPNFWNCLCVIFLWVRKTFVQLGDV